MNWPIRFQACHPFRNASISYLPVEFFPCADLNEILDIHLNRLRSISFDAWDLDLTNLSKRQRLLVRSIQQLAFQDIDWICLIKFSQGFTKSRNSYATVPRSGGILSRTPAFFKLTRSAITAGECRPNVHIYLLGYHEAPDGRAFIVLSLRPWQLSSKKVTNIVEKSVTKSAVAGLNLKS